MERDPHAFKPLRITPACRGVKGGHVWRVRKCPFCWFVMSILSTQSFAANKTLRWILHEHSSPSHSTWIGLSGAYEERCRTSGILHWPSIGLWTRKGPRSLFAMLSCYHGMLQYSTAGYYCVDLSIPSLVYGNTTFQVCESCVSHHDAKSERLK